MSGIPTIRFSLLLLTGFALADIAAQAVTPLAVTGWAGQVLVITGLAVLAGFFTVLWPVRAAADIAFYIALWWALAALGSLGTYLAAAHGAGLVDDALLSIDRALFFDWTAWMHIIDAHPWLATGLHVAYISLLPQIILSVVLFALVAPDRNELFFAAAALALAVTTLVSVILPAAGMFSALGEPFSNTPYVKDFALVRTPGLHVFELGDLQGIISFPSYHTILAIIFIMVHRGLTWSFYPVLALNAVMLLAIPTEGGHYVADMLGGLPVALGALATSSRVLTRMQERASPSRGWSATRALKLQSPSSRRAG